MPGKEKFTRNLTDNDTKVWNSYIKDLWNKPETKFNPKKGTDHALQFSLDLHGMSIQQAFTATNIFVEEHRINGSKSVIIISGKSGKIADELPFWIENIGCVRKIEPILDSQGGAGAYLISLFTQRR